MPYLFEDYRDWYQREIIAQIDDTDIRRVAEVLNHHYGRENRVEIEPACIAIWDAYNPQLDRKFRDICEILTTVYHFPVGSSAGCSGRWRCKPEEIETVRAELERRRDSINERIAAYQQAIFPPEEPVIPAVFERAKQASLF